jgi:hypothetical protein
VQKLRRLGAYLKKTYMTCLKGFLLVGGLACDLQKEQGFFCKKAGGGFG